MDTPDRLAAYLAGELSPAETSAVEDELARDAGLRAQLSAMRRADGALLALRSPEPSEGFDARLRASLEPVLAEQLGTAEQRQETSGGGTFDQLAERRADPARGRNRWIPALAGVAAAAAAVAVLTNVDLGGADDGVADVAMDDADDGAFETFSDEAGDAEMADGAGPAPPAGPTVVVSDRELGPDELDAVLAAPELQQLRDQGYVREVGDHLADTWSLTLGVDAGRTLAQDLPTDDAVDADEAEEEARPDEPSIALEQAPLRAAGDRPMTEDEEADVARCLDYVTAGGPSAIPAYVEFGTYDGTDAIVFALVLEHPDTRTFTRTQLWVVDRDDCAVLLLRPADD